MRAAAFGAGERSVRGQFGGEQQVAQVERLLPGWVEASPAGDTKYCGAGLQFMKMVGFFALR